MRFLGALLAGLLFGSGLLLSRMSDPQRVLSFLDVAGAWNPALAFTMGGAIAVAAPAFWWAHRRHRTLLHRPIKFPDRLPVDAALIGGSAIFGLGWGLSGICPGPGLLLLTSGTRTAIVFVGGMVAGFFLLSALRRRSS